MREVVIFKGVDIKSTNSQVGGGGRYAVGNEVYGVPSLYRRKILSIILLR